MKVGIYVSAAKYPAEIFDSVSGHAQLALFTANILAKYGYEVTLITNKAPLGYYLPPIASRRICVKTVTGAFEKYPEQKFRLSKVYSMFSQLRRLISSSDFDVIHFFGVHKASYLLGLLKATTRVFPITFMTFATFNASKLALRNLLTTKLLKNIDVLVTLTNYTKAKVLQSGLGSVVDESKVMVIQPGIGKQFGVDKSKPFPLNSGRYVLFWRNANRENGADLCAEVFKQLSSEYSDTDFIFAVRPGGEYEKLLRISETHKNIQLLRYPYKANITITDLLASATVVVLPFRKLSINPQFAILETLASGAPLITTPVESNREIIKHRETGILVSPTVNDIATAIRGLLNNPSFAREIGLNAKYRVQEEWNWEKYAEKLMSLYENAKTTRLKSKRI